MDCGTGIHECVALTVNSFHFLVIYVRSGLEFAHCFGNIPSGLKSLVEEAFMDDIGRSIENLTECSNEVGVVSKIEQADWAIAVRFFDPRGFNFAVCHATSSTSDIPPFTFIDTSWERSSFLWY